MDPSDTVKILLRSNLTSEEQDAICAEHDGLWEAAEKSKEASLRKDYVIACLEQQVKHLCADAAELDHDIREAAKRVLPADQVDGDRECVPPLAEVVEAVVQQVSADHPDADCTDAAHPAWWRGNEHATIAMCQRINAILDGTETVAGVASEPWESTRQRLAALRADAERYRHVRATENHASWHLYDNDQLKAGEELDAAVDAARNKQEG